MVRVEGKGRRGRVGYVPRFLNKEKYHAVTSPNKNTKTRKPENYGPLEGGATTEGFRVWGLGFRVWGLGFRVWGLGFGV